MECGTRIIYPHGLNIGFDTRFQRIKPEEGRNVQRQKYGYENIKL